MTKKTSNRYSPEVQERAVRMVLEHGSDHASQWAAISSIASRIGCTGETLRKWVRQAERDRGQPGFRFCLQYLCTSRAPAGLVSSHSASSACLASSSLLVP